MRGNFTPQEVLSWPGSQNANRILQTSFAQGLTNTAPLVQRAGRIISTGGARTVDIGGGAFGAIGATLTNTATTQALSDWFTFTASHTVTKKVVKHVAPVHTVNGDYGFEQLGAQLAQSAIKTFDKLFFDGLEGLFGAAHPRAGIGDGLVGAGKKYLDTGLLLAGGATQDNLVAAALDETSLNAAIKLMLQYRSDRGIPLHLGSNGGLVLVVSPANAKVAHELVVSQAQRSGYGEQLRQGHHLGHRCVAVHHRRPRLVLDRPWPTPRSAWRSAATRRRASPCRWTACFTRRWPRWIAASSSRRTSTASSAATFPKVRKVMSSASA